MGGEIHVKHLCLMVSIVLASTSVLTLTAPRASAAILDGYALDQTSIKLEWEPECLDGPPGDPCNMNKTTDYTIYMKNGSYQQPWVSIQFIDNPVITEYTVIGLQHSTTYQFYIVENIWYDHIDSNIITVQTLHPPNQDPSISVTAPTSGQTVEAGKTLTIMWTVGDDRDPPADLVVYLNFTGPATGTISGPLSGSTNSLVWTVPSQLQGNGFRITAIILDTEGGWRVTESAEFTVLAATGGGGGGGGDSGLWIFSTAILSVIVAGLTAGLFLAVRIQLAEWYRSRKERKKQGQPPRPGRDQ